MPLEGSSWRATETLAFGAPIPDSPWLDVEAEAPSQGGPGALRAAHFTGHQLDTDSGLHNMHLRMYSAEFMRFLRPDPALDVSLGDPGSWNLYAYVGNDPANVIDPTGGLARYWWRSPTSLEFGGLAVSAPVPVLDWSLSAFFRDIHDLANDAWYGIGGAEGALRIGAVGTVVVGMVALSSVPMVGEAMDVVACATGSPADCVAVAGSLALNAATAGTAPNFGMVRLTNRIRKLAGPVMRSGDDVVGGALAKAGTATVSKLNDVPRGPYCRAGCEDVATRIQGAIGVDSHRPPS